MSVGVLLCHTVFELFYQFDPDWIASLRQTPQEDVRDSLYGLLVLLSCPCGLQCCFEGRLDAG